MSLLDGPLAAVFSAAFGALFQDGVLHSVQEAPTGAGGFAVQTTDTPVKLCVEGLGASARAASGLPASAVRITVLRGATPVTVNLDDGLSAGGTTYRVIGLEGDAAGAAQVATVVPATVVPA